MTGSEYARDSGFGDGVNRTKFDDHGHMQAEGDATVWEDIVGSLVGRRLYSVVGTLDYDFSENAISMGSGGGITDLNDTLVFNLQYPHGAVTDGGLHLHIHWEQTDATDREFTVEYRIQSNGMPKNTTWTQVVVQSGDGNVATWTSGTLNQITELCEVDMTNAGLSATVQFRLARTDSVAGAILSTFVDAHALMDMNGSRDEYVK